MAARRPAPTPAQPGDRKVSAIAALVAAGLAAIGGTAFFLQSDPGPAPPAHQTPPAEPAGEAPATHPEIPPTPPAVPPATMPEKVDRSTKPKPPPRDPG